MLNKLDCKFSRIELYYGKKSCTMYYFNCKECSKEIKYRAVELKRVSGFCRTCSSKKIIKKNAKPKTTKRAYERNYNNFIRLNKDKTIDLTYEEYLVFCEDPKCHYCLKEINRSVTGNKYGQGYFLDRKDNNLGYIKSNLVNCCTRCNFSKSNRYTYEEWYGMTRYFRDKYEET